jgi:invasion protein IalB
MMPASLLRLRLLLCAAAVTVGAATAAIAQQHLPSAPRPAPSVRAQAPSAQQPAAPAATLPNGAAAINETYGDWTVDCRIVDRQKQCVLSQVQRNKDSGQRVFGIELRPLRDGKTEGTVVMPFGLNLDAGALLKLDDKDLGKGLRFSTCVPQGCLLPVSFTTVATDAMRKASKLVIASLSLSSNEPITFNVSLDGFSATLTRTTELAK